MKEKLKENILMIVILLAIIAIPILGICLATHPEIRHISYYDNNDYYMVNVVVCSGRSEKYHFGAIKKDDYNKWANQENGSIWVVSSKDESRGWRLNIGLITTIQIYDRKWLPLNF